MLLIHIQPDFSNPHLLHAELTTSRFQNVHSHMPRWETSISDIKFIDAANIEKRSYQKVTHTLALELVSGLFKSILLPLSSNTFTWSTLPSLHKAIMFCLGTGRFKSGFRVTIARYLFYWKNFPHQSYSSLNNFLDPTWRFHHFVTTHFLRWSSFL